MKNKTLFTVLALAFALIAGLAGCAVDESAPGEGMGDTAQMFIMLGVFIAIFYFLLIRPQRKKQKEHETLVGELRRGDKVITNGGIYGTIESISEDSVVLKVESGATLRVTKDSIGGKRSRK